MSVTKIIDEANKRMGIKSISEALPNAIMASICYADRIIEISHPQVVKTEIGGKTSFMINGSYTIIYSSKDKGDNL